MFENARPNVNCCAVVVGCRYYHAGERKRRYIEGERERLTKPNRSLPPHGYTFLALLALTGWSLICRFDLANGVARPIGGFTGMKNIYTYIPLIYKHNKRIKERKEERQKHRWAYYSPLRALCKCYALVFIIRVLMMYTCGLLLGIWCEGRKRDRMQLQTEGYRSATCCATCWWTLATLLVGFWTTYLCE